MFVAVGMQVAAVLVVALVTGLVLTWSDAASVSLGGVAAIIPNGLFALRLASHRGKPAESYPAVFFLGEFGKIALTAALLALIARTFDSVSWLPLLIGLIVALQAPLFALMVVRDEVSGVATGVATGASQGVSSGVLAAAGASQNPPDAVRPATSKQ